MIDRKAVQYLLLFFFFLLFCGPGSSRICSLGSTVLGICSALCLLCLHLTVLCLCQSLSIVIRHIPFRAAVTGRITLPHLDETVCFQDYLCFFKQKTGCAFAVIDDRCLLEHVHGIFQALPQQCLILNIISCKDAFKDFPAGRCIQDSCALFSSHVKLPFVFLDACIVIAGTLSMKRTALKFSFINHGSIFVIENSFPLIRTIFKIAFIFHDLICKIQNAGAGKLIFLELSCILGSSPWVIQGSVSIKIVVFKGTLIDQYAILGPQGSISCADTCGNVSGIDHIPVCCPDIGFSGVFSQIHIIIIIVDGCGYIFCGSGVRHRGCDPVKVDKYCRTACQDQEIYQHSGDPEPAHRKIVFRRLGLPG